MAEHLFMGEKKICVLPSPFSDPDTEKCAPYKILHGLVVILPWAFSKWGFPKMVVIPQQFPWVFLLKMIILGCEMGDTTI